MDFSPELLAMPAGLGALLGLALGLSAARATTVPAKLIGRLAAAALLGFFLGAAAGVGGGLLVKPVPLCRVGGIAPSALPHSLFLAPILAAAGGLVALLLAARRRGLPAGAAALLWVLPIAVPTVVALFFGKTTTSPNPLFRDCVSVGMRLVANAALTGAVLVAFATLAVHKRRGT